MRMLVTGGLGFIGSHFIRLVLTERQDIQVLNLDAMTYAANKENVADVADVGRYGFMCGSIGDYNRIDLLMRSGFDAVVNFAAESHVDRSLDGLPTEFIRTNLEGTTVLLDAAKKHQVRRFLQVSTDEVYGDVEAGESSTEGAPLRPNNPYSVTKAAADQMVLSYVRSFGLHAVITRSTNNYGPRQYPEKFIPVVISKALKDEPIPVYGDGLQEREWLHVKDNCRGILAALEEGQPGHVYNLGSENRKTNHFVALSVLNLLKKPDSLLKYVTDRPGHDRRYALDSSKAKRELNWESQMPFMLGLEETVRWYREAS